MSLKVIEIGAIRRLGYGFLFDVKSNYGAILYRLQDIAIYWSKIAKKITPPVFSVPTGVTVSEFRQYNMFDTHKTRMIGLPGGEETLTILC